MIRSSNIQGGKARSKRPLVLFGNTAFAEIAFEYFSHDSEYAVDAFTVHERYIQQKELLGRPVVPFEQIETLYPPDQVEMFIAMTYHQQNRLRTGIYQQAKGMGYRLASYISSRAFVWHNVEVGDNCFIFEDNTVQPFVRIGSNVILWSGNHIGHHSIIRDHNFISSQVVISGFCDVGPSCFFGVNSTVANNITIGADCLIGAGALVVKETQPGEIHLGTKSTTLAARTYEKFGITADAMEEAGAPR
jgi:sugar O-acyltransferase (sialic acid O-acetyltransferase NeuD family)